MESLYNGRMVFWFLDIGEESIEDKKRFLGLIPYIVKYVFQTLYNGLTVWVDIWFPIGDT